MDMKASLDGAGVVEQEPDLRQAAGQASSNLPFTLSDLRARANRVVAHRRLHGVPPQRAGHPP